MGGAGYCVPSMITFRMWERRVSCSPLLVKDDALQQARCGKRHCWVAVMGRTSLSALQASCRLRSALRGRISAVLAGHGFPRKTTFRKPLMIKDAPPRPLAPSPPRPLLNSVSVEPLQKSPGSAIFAKGSKNQDFKEGLTSIGHSLSCTPPKVKYHEDANRLFPGRADSGAPRLF